METFQAVLEFLAEFERMESPPLTPWPKVQKQLEKNIGIIWPAVEITMGVFPVSCFKTLFLERIKYFKILPGRYFTCQI